MSITRERINASVIAAHINAAGNWAPLAQTEREFNKALEEGLERQADGPACWSHDGTDYVHNSHACLIGCDA